MSTKPFIIGIHGASESGKSTLAEVLQAELYDRDQIADISSFASPLKFFCTDVLGLDFEQVFGNKKHTLTKWMWGDMPEYLNKSVWNDTILDYVYIKDMYAFDAYMTARQVMQFWATEIFREMNENIFVDRFMESLELLCPTVEYVIADDVRFQNEMDVLDYSIKLEAKVSDAHKSEKGLDSRGFDMVYKKHSYPPNEMAKAILLDKVFQ